MRVLTNLLRIRYTCSDLFNVLQGMFVNFFQAAGHVHRFLTLDENVLRMSAGANEGLSIAFCVNSSLQLNFNMCNTSHGICTHLCDVYYLSEI